MARRAGRGLRCDRRLARPCASTAAGAVARCRPWTALWLATGQARRARPPGAVAGDDAAAGALAGDWP